MTSSGGDLIVSPNNITVANNTFVDTPGDGLDVGAGTITGNYFSGGGYLVGSHADAIWVPDTTGPVSITNNFIDWTTSPGTVLPITLFESRSSKEAPATSRFPAIT